MTDLCFSEKKQFRVLTEEALEEIFSAFNHIDDDIQKDSSIRKHISSCLDEIIDETNIREFIQENIERAQNYITQLENQQLIAPEDISLQPALHTISQNIKENLYPEEWFGSQLMEYLDATVETPLDVHCHYLVCFLVRILQAENYCESDNIVLAKQSLKEAINNYKIANEEIDRVVDSRIEKAEEEKQMKIRKKQERVRKARKGGNARAKKFLPIKQEIIRIIENPPSGSWPDKMQLKSNIINAVLDILDSTKSHLLKRSNLDETISKWLSTDETIKPVYEQALHQIVTELPKKVSKLNSNPLNTII